MSAARSPGVGSVSRPVRFAQLSTARRAMRSPSTSPASCALLRTPLAALNANWCSSMRWSRYWRKPCLSAVMYARRLDIVDLLYGLWLGRVGTLVHLGQVNRKVEHGYVIDLVRDA